MVHDTSTSGVTLEGQDIALKWRGEFPVFLDHIVGRQSRDGIPGCVLMFKCLLELSEEVVPGSKGYDSASDGFFLEGISPGQGRPCGHV